ncbi:MAG TPA: TetR family transcriptional regulator C-terminal domain-containing protein [Gemmatimonadaceae bacterium]|nr:TetR family transcriptional regulator C-terminal domain-containing protein [Gemmatimonadaceae bacterium]
MDRPVGLAVPPSPHEMHETKRRLILAGLRLMLERGYNGVGIQDILNETGVPKGSFYHHFEAKEDFAMQLLDAYAANAHALLDATLSDTSRPPLERIRNFFEGIRESYAAEGYLGCFLGALGQELSGVSEIFRQKIGGCVDAIATRIAYCLEEARARGDLPAGTDPVQMADVLVDAWEGAALRTRLVRNGRPLKAVLDFYFAAVAAR